MAKSNGKYDFVIKRAEDMTKLQSATRKHVYALFTVDGARALYELQAKNRQVRLGHVRFMGREMDENRWDADNPQPLSFDKRGRLLDGQHRLLAQILAERDMVWFCALGVTEKTARTSDGGIPRTLPDRLYAFNTHKAVSMVVADSHRRAKQAASIVGYLNLIIMREKKLPFDDTCKVIKHFAESMSWVLENAGTHSITKRGPLLAALVIAREWASLNDELDVFHNVVNGLKSGEMIEGAVRKLRDHLVMLSKHSSSWNAKAARGDTPWILFTKSMRALQAALGDEPLPYLRAPTKPRLLAEWFFEQSCEDIAREMRLLHRFRKSQVAAEAS